VTATIRSKKTASTSSLVEAAPSITKEARTSGASRI